MRLIYAEELKRSIAVSALIEDQKTLEQIIDEQPTIEERKIGKWELIIDGNEFGESYPVGCYCSECGFQSCVEDNYCPNCGADMRGET